MYSTDLTYAVNKLLCWGHTV